MRCLFVFSIIQFYREMFPVAEAARAAGHEVLVVVDWVGPAAVEARRACENCGIQVVEIDDRLRYGDPHAHEDEPPADYQQFIRPGGVLDRLVQLARPLIPAEFRRRLSALAHAYGRQRLAIREAARCLETTQPDIVLLGPFLGYRFELATVYAAAFRRIPSVVLPVFEFIHMDSLGPWKLYLEPSARRRKSVALRMVERLLPGCVVSYNGRSTFITPAHECLIACVTGLQRRDRLTVPYGPVTKITLMHEYARMTAVQDHDPAKLVVTGKPTLDEAYRRLQRRGAAVEDGRLAEVWRPRRILFAVPPLWEHGLIERERHFAYLETVLQTLDDCSDLHVTLSLHPLCSPGAYETLVRRHRVQLAENVPVAELMADCDIFVAVFSSTFAYAVACRKPIVVPDFVGWEGFDYQRPVYQTAGTVLASSPAAFRQVLRRLEEDPAYYEELHLGQEETARLRASHFDGQATQRVVELIERTVNVSRGNNRGYPPKTLYGSGRCEPRAFDGFGASILAEERASTAAEAHLRGAVPALGGLRQDSGSQACQGGV